MQIDPDALLGEPAVEAGVAALATRNRSHLEAMTESEREGALTHWRELTIDVLAAARSALAEERDGSGGRATIVLEDAGGEEIAVHATFEPELEELPGGEVAGTRAQIAAVELLEAIADSDGDGDGE